MAKRPSLSWLRVGYLVLAAVVMYLLISQVGSLKGSLSQLKNSHSGDDLLALVGVAVTYFMAALSYYFLSFKRLAYFRTVVVEVGINSLNRLLPAGLGGIGANYLYLHRSGQTKAQSEAAVATNTAIGIIANVLLLVSLVWYFGLSSLHIKSLKPQLILVIVALVIVLALAVIIGWPSLRAKIARNLKSSLVSIGRYRKRKARLLGSLFCQIVLTLAYVLALSFSLRAVGGHLPFGDLMACYSFGIWLGAVVPAPGGVGSVEAGLVSGLVAFKLNLMTAVAAVVIFRILSFWLPLLVGIGPLIWSYRKRYL